MGALAQIDREGKPQIKALYPHHKSMARTMVKHGLTPSQLAALYNFSVSQVSVILNSPLFKAHVAYLESLSEADVGNVGMDLRALGPRSVEVLAEDLAHDVDAGIEDRKLRNSTALQVLDRIGHPKGVPVQEHKHLHGHLHKTVREMSDQELYNEVMNMIDQGEDDDA